MLTREPTPAIDALFTGGHVYQPGATSSLRADVAIGNGRIVAIGPPGDLGDLGGPHTERIDLTGQLLLPSFQDAHVHAVVGGLRLLQCDLSEADSSDDCFETIRAYARSHPDEEWVIGAGWAMEHFPGGEPTRHTLDQVVPDRPVVLTSQDFHALWVNSRALEIAGLDATTPDPPDGRIAREPDGYPSGTLHEGAGALVRRFLPATTTDQLLAGLAKAQDMFFSLGVTAWQDAALTSTLLDTDLLPLYVEADRTGALKARVVGCSWWHSDKGLEQISSLRERRDLGAGRRFTAGSVKIMQDGIIENRTAGMLAPYFDSDGRLTDTAGFSLIDPSDLRGHVTALDAEGFQVHVHAIGDRAVRDTLDAIGAARAANGPNDNRHHIAHLWVVDPQDLPRFAQVDAIATFQPFWAAHSDLMDACTTPLLGADRAGLQLPFESVRRLGAKIAFGSDWSVSSPNPLDGIHVAVNRVLPGTGAQPFFPENCMTLADALTAYTAGSAHANHLDATGSITLGALADLVVLDRDLFAHPLNEIADAQVLRTYVEGELVYDAAS